MKSTILIYIEERALESAMGRSSNVMQHISVQSDQVYPKSYNNAPPQPKKKYIEEEDFIYKVPCDPRETISLRDS